VDLRILIEKNVFTAGVDSSRVLLPSDKKKRHDESNKIVKDEKLPVPAEHQSHLRPPFLSDIQT
jgi:hypothetical protein